MLKATEEKRKLKKAEVANAIIEAAAPLIHDRSFTQISIQEFCESAGITTGMFYRHFKTKNDLLAVVYMREADQVLQEIPETTRDLSLKDKLIEMGLALCRCSQMLGPDGLLMYLPRDSGAFDCEASRDSIEETVSKLIVDAEASGEPLPEGKTAKMLSDDIALLLKGATFEWYTKGSSYDIESSMKSLLTRLMPAILYN